MARIQYAEGATHLIKSIGGSSVASNYSGQSLKKKSRQKHSQSPAAISMRNFLISAASKWKSLTLQEQTNWHNWAAAFPQPQKRDQLKSLKAFQNFTKINFFRKLYQGAAFQFFVNPALTIYNSDILTIKIYRDTNSVQADFQFQNHDSTLFFFIFISGTKSAGKDFVNQSPIFFTAILNANQTIDATSFFLSNFAMLPAIDQIIFSLLLCLLL